MAVVCLAAVAQACSVPVFRYALDHWTPDKFRISVVHDEPLTAEQSEIVQRLQAEVSARFTNATIDVRQVPELASEYPTATDGPLCLVQAPTDDAQVVWTGPVSAETVDAMLGSPVRNRLIKSLLDGTSVVWIYLEAGIAPIDDANFKRLETELERLQGVIKLPEIDAADLKELSTSPEDVKLKFDALRLARDNPAEALLVEMLLSSEPDLRDATYVNQPMAFPVFGRGRVLYSLVGEGISAELIEEACRFLTGACQCTVKAQNPGSELLLSADWDGLISPSAPTEVDVTLTGLAGFQSDVAASAVASDDEPTVSTPAAIPAESQTIESPASAPTLETVAVDVEPFPTAAEVVSRPDAVDWRQTAVLRRAASEPSAATRPIVLILILGLVVVAGSFFLLPRR